MPSYDYLEDTRPPYRLNRGRVPSRFERWAWSPAKVYRLSLTVLYVASTYFGVSALVAGIPAFLSTAPHWWTFFWAVALIIGSITAAVGSLRDTMLFERFELVGTILLFITIGSYAVILLVLAYGLGDTNRAAAGAGFIALGSLPGMRMLWLISQVFVSRGRRE